MKKIHSFFFVFVLLTFDFLALMYGISTLSIGANEAEIYFTKGTLLYYLTHFGTFIFGQNDFGLRIVFVFFHILSAILLYILALKYTKTPKDSFFALVLFILLPGTLASALLVDEASVVIFLTLVILCAYEYEKKILFYFVFICVLFVDKSFNILFLSFFFFGIYKKNTPLLTLSLLLFAASLAMYGYDIGGKPKGYFLDTLGIFAACFSPLVFIYFFYVLYRLSFKTNKSLLWFLMSVTFVFCSLLSLRQKLYLEDFLPFCVVCTPLLIQNLMASYRVRLPKFRLKYKILIQCAMIFLVFCYFLIIANKILYNFLSDPTRHFAYNYHLAKELSIELKKQNIKTLQVAPSLQKRLKFYGIENSKKFYLKNIKNSQNINTNRKILEVQLGKHTKKYQILSYEKSL